MNNISIYRLRIFSNTCELSVMRILARVRKFVKGGNQSVVILLILWKFFAVVCVIPCDCFWYSLWSPIVAMYMYGYVNCVAASDFLNFGRITFFMFCNVYVYGMVHVLLLFEYIPFVSLFYVC